MPQSKHKENILELLTVLRSENPTQYCTLIKMHLSFVTDLSTDQCDGSFDSGVMSNGKWILSPLMKKLIRGNNNQQNNSKAMLTYDVVNQIFHMMSFLKKEENITQEGLFRKTGSVSRQAELKTLLLAGQNLNLESGHFSAHDCASVLKSFLSDLPEPILQEGEYHVHCRIAELCRKKLTDEQESVAHNRQVKALSLVFLLLPAVNYELLKELLMLLHQVTLFQDKNKMSSINLGTMFAPHILCPRKMSPNELQYQSSSLSSTVAFIIENAPQLFQIPSELAIDVREYFRTEAMGRQLSKRSMEDAPTKTSMTFIDRELTAEANDKDVTEMALAELYAYVQSLPDSAKKKKLISKFNEVSGPGTPKYNQSFQKKDLKAKSIGDSIKKHLFNRSIKKSKQKISLTNSLNIKRSKSDDYLSTSVFCSPVLRSSPKCASKVKTKSLENLLSPKLSNFICTANNSSLEENEVSMIENAYSHDCVIANACSDEYDIHSSSTPITKSSSSNENEEEQKQYCNTPVRKGGGLVSIRRSKPVTLKSKKFSISGQNKIEEKDENVEDNDGKISANNESYQSCRSSPDPALCSVYKKEQIISPISRALRNTVDPQKLMLTPRSRRPIIVNSTTSLSSVVIQEEDSTENELNLKNLSNMRDRDQSEEEIKEIPSSLANGSRLGIIKNESKPLSPRTQDLSSSFEYFYKRLSAPTLEKLADNLKSPKSCLRNTDGENSGCQDAIHNETLTSVFKDYLLSRSILTENLANLSSENILNESNFENKKIHFQKYECDDSSQNEHNLQNGTNYPELSKSLLFCLDGNNPSYLSSTPKRSSISSEKSPSSSTKKLKQLGKSNRTCDQSTLLEETEAAALDTCDRTSSDLLKIQSTDLHTSTPLTNLHSCTPNGRRSSLFKNKNGTPIPKKEKENGAEGNSMKNILFETEL